MRDDEIKAALRDAVGDGIKTLHERIDSIEAQAKQASHDDQATRGRRRITREPLPVGLSKKDAMAPRGTPGVRLGKMVRSALTGDPTGLSGEERKAMEGALGASGGFLLNETVAPFIIDRARARARVIEAGAITVPMESQTVHIPRLDSAVSPTWRAENEDAAESAPSIGRVTLRARSCAVLVKISWEMVEDTSEEGLAAIENELVQAVALKLDYAALAGAGSEEEPLGILNTPGVPITNLGANGATPSDWDHVVDAYFSVVSADFEPTAALMHPRTAKTLAKLVTGLASDKTKLTPPPALDDLPRMLTTQLPTAQTVGTNSDCTSTIVGDFSRVVIGVRPEIGIRVVASDAPGFSKLQRYVVVWTRADVAVTQPTAFAVAGGIRP